HAKLFARDEGAFFFAPAATTEDTRGLDCTKSPLMAEHERLPFRKRRCRLEAAPPARDPSGARKSMVLQEVFESKQRLKGCPPRRHNTSQAAAALPSKDLLRRSRHVMRRAEIRPRDQVIVSGGPETSRRATRVSSQAEITPARVRRARLSKLPVTSPSSTPSA